MDSTAAKRSILLARIGFLKENRYISIQLNNVSRFVIGACGTKNAKKKCRDLYRRDKRAPVIALDKLIWTLAESASSLPTDDLMILANQLRILRDEEADLRGKTVRDGMTFNVRMVRLFSVPKGNRLTRLRFQTYTCVCIAQRGSEL